MKRSNMARNMSIPRYPRVCAKCTKDFLARVGTQKYCEDCRESINALGRGENKSLSFKYKSKICPKCKKDFIPTTGNQKYCISCRQDVIRERSKSYTEHAPQLKTCPQCGEQYEVTGNNQKYCLKCSKFRDSLEFYRNIAFDNLPNKCNRCGKPVTYKTSHVHHKDRDHGNYTVGNLEILCIPCHRNEHIIRDSKTGKIITNK